MTSAIASEICMESGRLRSGSRTSPPTAAMRSKPWSAMNVYPIAWISPIAPVEKNGVSCAPRSAGGAVTKANAPPAITAANTTTLPIVAHWPPPALRRSRLAA
jgi:hypothetical protein